MAVEVMMNIEKAFDEKMALYEDYKKMMKDLKKAMDEIEADVREIMDVMGVDTYATDAFKVINNEVVTKRFDSKAFKADFPEMYDEYVKESVSRPFKDYVLD